MQRDTSAIITEVRNNPDKYHVQIIYTQITRKPDCEPIFTDYVFRLKPREYFFPASLIKLPAAIMALEKMKTLSSLHIDATTPFLPLSNYSCKPDADYLVKRIPESMYSTLSKMLIVSDNDAFNRVYEFIGQKAINRRMREWGYPDARIIERIALCDSLSQRTTGPVLFIDTLKELRYLQPAEFNDQQLVSTVDTPTVGQGYIEHGNIIPHPKSFKYSNCMDLATIHGLLKGIMFRNPLFQLNDSDYHFLQWCLSSYPREAGIEKYCDEQTYCDGYLKFFLFGGSKDRIGEHIRMFSKPGMAYGFMTETAYIVDYNKRVEFMLSAVIYCNEDEILNDERYDYTRIGLPFFKQLSSIIFEYEAGRTKEKRSCDLPVHGR